MRKYVVVALAAAAIALGAMQAEANPGTGSGGVSSRDQKLEVSGSGQATDAVIGSGANGAVESQRDARALPGSPEGAQPL